MLTRARRVYDTLLTRVRFPDATMPVYIENRVDAGAKLPFVLVIRTEERIQLEHQRRETVAEQRGKASQGQQPADGAKRKRQPRAPSHQEVECDEVVHFIIRELHPELYTELLLGLRHTEAERREMEEK